MRRKKSNIIGLMVHISVSVALMATCLYADQNSLAQMILANKDFDTVLTNANTLLKAGFTAGSGYPQCWVRDFNTFIQMSLRVNNNQLCRSALLGFFFCQDSVGEIPDWYILSALQPSRVADGITGQNENGEWASNGELNPWLRMDFPTVQGINQIVFYDRVNTVDNCNGGTISFSDGTTISVSGIPTDGTAKAVTFPAKNVLWFKFQVVGGSGKNVGLSEVQAFNASNANVAQLPGVIVTASSTYTSEVHTTTAETDEESSLIQAVAKYLDITRDSSLLNENVRGVTVVNRIRKAIDYLHANRWSQKYGLLWGGTRPDWGDKQALLTPTAANDNSSALDADYESICIYDNAMLVRALNDYVSFLPPGDTNGPACKTLRDSIKTNIRNVLYDSLNQKYRCHVYLNADPWGPQWGNYNSSWNENAIYYHGGTSEAMLAGLLDSQEVSIALAKMEDDVVKAKAGTLGLTMFPTYPLGYFPDPALTAPYTYQNGGDWDWFGGRTIQALVQFGLVQDAYDEFLPMISRCKKYGFWEWFTPGNQPSGSGNFQGSAGQLGWAIVTLRNWATNYLAATETGKPALVRSGKDAVLLSVRQISRGCYAVKISKLTNDIPAKLFFYSIDGRKVGFLPINGKADGEFRKELPNGIYFANLDVNGVCLKITQFVVER